MDGKTLRSQECFSIDVDAISRLIVNTQKDSGEIPWSIGDKTDPWDMVEAAMGLSIGGFFQEARKAFTWLAGMQLPDGSWYAAYKNGVAEDETRDTNMSSYIAVGLYHYYLTTSDKAFLDQMWPTLEKAITFTLSLQAASGVIYWAISPEDEVDPMALLTGSSSIYMSLKCALAIAALMGIDKPAWEGLKIKPQAIESILAEINKEFDDIRLFITYTP